MGSSMITINQQKLKKINDEKRIIELKKLLSDSDYKMTTDYFNSMSPDQQIDWTQKRKDWREEIRSLE
jgi:uncharacterized protein